MVTEDKKENAIYVAFSVFFTDLKLKEINVSQQNDHRELVEKETCL